MSTNAIPESRETHLTDIESYVMASDNPITNLRRGGRHDQSTILTYADGTEWVFLTNKAKERFCGFLYMQNAIKEAGLAKVKAAQNKMAIVEDEQHGQKLFIYPNIAVRKNRKYLNMQKSSLLSKKILDLQIQSQICEKSRAKSTYLIQRRVALTKEYTAK